MGNRFPEDFCVHQCTCDFSFPQPREPGSDDEAVNIYMRSRLAPKLPAIVFFLSEAMFCPRCSASHVNHRSRSRGYLIINVCFLSATAAHMSKRIHQSRALLPTRCAMGEKIVEGWRAQRKRLMRTHQRRGNITAPSFNHAPLPGKTRKLFAHLFLGWKCPSVLAFTSNKHGEIIGRI